MGELNKWDASIKRNNYEDSLQRMKQAVRKNFEDMDFENAMKRNEAESLVISMEDCIQRRINALSGMGFE